MLMAGTLIAGCAIAGQAARPGARSAGLLPAPLAIDKVRVEPKTIDTQRPDVASLHYELSRDATVRIDLVDEEGAVVRRLEVGRQPAGLQQFRWDGRDAAGTLVSAGVYRYVIIGETPDGQSARHDPSAQTGGEELEPRDFTFDRQTGRFAWVMPRAGRARLRIGVEGFPHLRTLLDWQPLEAGRQEVVWDGLDASGFIRAIDHENLSVKLSAFALPDNTVIVRGLPRAQLPPGDSPHAAYPPLGRVDAAYVHARHPRAVCHEALMSLEFPQQTAIDSEGRPIVQGSVPVRVTLDPRDAAHLVNARFEVALYEDLTFLFEEEAGTNPFTFLWDTSRLTPGAHLLTINVLSYDDHYGTFTQPVIIQSQP